MPARWRNPTSFIAFLFLLPAASALAGPGAFGVAAYPVCQPRGVHLSWSSSSGASSYRVFRGGQAIGSVLPASSLSFDDNTSGSSYSVVATDSHGFTFSSNNVTPPAPNSSFCLGGDLQVGQAAYCAVSGPAVHLAWTAGSSSSYFITDASGNFVAVVDGSKSSYDVTGLINSKAYGYSVNGFDANNGQLVTTPSCPGPPGSFTLTGSTSCANNAVSVLLTWTAASGATQYRVSRDGVVINTTTSRTFTDTAVVSAHAYSYVISALNSSGSTESNTISVTAATCSPPPGAFAASAAAFCTTGASPSPAVHVTWTASANASSYIVNRNGAVYSTSLPSTVLTLDDLNVSIGQTYSYTVTATNAGGSTVSSGQSVSISSSTCPSSPPPPPSAPVLTGSTVCNGTSPSIHLSWTASTITANYMVFRNGTALSLLLSPSTLAYDDDSVEAAQTYSYFVRASNGGGIADSNTVNISLLSTICQPPPQPFTLSAKAVCDISTSPAAVVNLAWAASANATAYLVFRDDVQIGSTATTAFTDMAPITSGPIHTYFIRASGQGGTTDSNSFDVHIDPSVCTASCGFACAANVVASMPAQSPVLFHLQSQTSCEIFTVTWTFGDGAASNALAPTHIYANAGTFHWTVTTAGGGNAQTCQNSGTITITEAPAPAKRHAVRH